MNFRTIQKITLFILSLCVLGTVPLLDAMSMAARVGEEFSYAWEGDFEARRNLAGVALGAAAAYGVYSLYKADKYGLKTKTQHMRTKVTERYRHTMDKAWNWQIPQITAGAITGGGVLLASYLVLDSFGLEPQAVGSVALGLAASAGAWVYNYIGQKYGPKVTITTPVASTLTFADIAGGVPAAVAGMVDDIQKHEKLSLAERRAQGLPPVTGVIFHGPPGTGKTRLAKAVAGQLGNIPFIQLQATAVMSKWYGNTEKAIREVFVEARQQALEHPSKISVLFIDEIDSIAAERTRNTDRHVPQPVNTLLEEIDKLLEAQHECQVIVIVGTNRLDILDKAFQRAGRFTYQIKIDLPDFEKRKAIFEYYLQQKLQQFTPSTQELEKLLGNLATLTVNKNAADIAGVIDEVVRHVKRGTIQTVTCDVIVKIARDMFAVKTQEIPQSKKSRICACRTVVKDSLAVLDKSRCYWHCERQTSGNLSDKRLNSYSSYLRRKNMPHTEQVESKRKRAAEEQEAQVEAKSMDDNGMGTGLSLDGP